MHIVKSHAPITGDHLADLLGVNKATIRSDLALLVMLGYIDAKPKVGYFLGKTSMPEKDKISLLEKKVSEVQGSPVVIQETASVSDAVVLLFTENVGSLIVVDADGMLAGIVSRKDLIKVTIGNASADKMPVSLVMSRKPNIVTVSPDDTVVEAARLMMAHEVDGLPVVRPADSVSPARLEVVGRITKTTMTRLLLEWLMES